MTNLNEIVRNSTLLREYLNEGHDIDDNNNDIGFTLLHFAIANNAFDSAEILVKEFNADPNIWNKQGYSPYHEVILKEKNDFTVLLAKNGGDPFQLTSYPEIESAENTDALNLSITILNPEIFKIIFESVDLDLVNENLITNIVDNIVSYRPDMAHYYLEVIATNHNDILTQVLKTHEHTLLEDATTKCSSDLMNFYLDYDLDFNYVYNNNGDNIGYFATANKCEEIIHTFIESGKVNMNAVVDEQGKNALHTASANFAYDIVEYLLDHNYDVNFASNNGKVALHYTIATEMKSDADDEYQQAFEEIQNSTIDVLLARPEIIVDAKDENGVTPIMYSAFLCKTEIFAKLVDKGANLLLVDNNGDNIFKYTNECDDFDKMTQITNTTLNHGANLEEPDKMHFLKMYVMEMGASLNNFYEMYPSEQPTISEL